ncbi:Holliday junction resolvase RuvX [Allonocardiopsis opalescens]|uniref:Putative pre-16S rRNA nuclease n=1 Tax=Allonocardiopsis opalescens TaxID=1144618 RepID=A0A2T0PWW2_9ACTN|nr:Holliday junction resolvase RuvX [Allonocardiopsis opalescens]PRX96024.1 putative Holliday junction resolvase [Allonocardiopsis opalescens]
MRRGVRLGVDVGSVRVGVARSDPDGLLATPVETVPNTGRVLDRLAELAREHAAVAVVVGLPTSLSGRPGPAAGAARDFAAALARRLAREGGAEVRLFDERLTTVTAERELRGSAGRGRGRGRARRQVIDQAAATVLLQAALDTERLTGKPPGEIVPVVI